MIRKALKPIATSWRLCLLKSYRGGRGTMSYSWTKERSLSLQQREGLLIDRYLSKSWSINN